MKKYLVIICLILSITGYTQTKMIAFKSHSGKMENFEKAFSNPKFDLMFHNLGAAPEPTISNSEIDSVIFISDSISIMITSNVCKNSPWYYGNDTTIDYKSKSVWSAGRDTIINHPLFSNQHSLDSIKVELKKQYNFQNNIDSTVFVGYDNGNLPVDEEIETAPIIENSSPNVHGPGMMIFFISLFAVLMGLVSWRLSRIIKGEIVKAA